MSRARKALTMTHSHNGCTQICLSHRLSAALAAFDQILRRCEASQAGSGKPLDPILAHTHIATCAMHAAPDRNALTEAPDDFSFSLPPNAGATNRSTRPLAASDNAGRDRY